MAGRCFPTPSSTPRRLCWRWRSPSTGSSATRPGSGDACRIRSSLMGRAIGWLDERLNKAGESFEDNRRRGIFALLASRLAPPSSSESRRRFCSDGCPSAGPSRRSSSRSSWRRRASSIMWRRWSECCATAGLKPGGRPSRKSSAATCASSTRPAWRAPRSSSAAENFSDGVVAPAFWFLLLGLPGLFVYKLANTADSMIGNRSPRHVAFGWAAARFDDLLNFVPARLSALLIVATAALVRLDARSAADIAHARRADAQIAERRLAGGGASPARSASRSAGRAATARRRSTAPGSIPAPRTTADAARHRRRHPARSMLPGRCSLVADRPSPRRSRSRSRDSEDRLEIEMSWRDARRGRRARPRRPPRSSPPIAPRASPERRGGNRRWRRGHAHRCRRPARPPRLRRRADRRSRGTAARNPGPRFARGGSRSPLPRRRFRHGAPSTGRVVLSPPRTVSTASRPSPATVPGRPSMPSGSAIGSARASGSRRRGRARAAAADDARRCRCPSPSRRSASRSAIVAFEPGIRIRSQSPGMAWPGSTISTSTSGSARSGSRSSKLAMRGSRGTAIRIFAPGFGRVGGKPEHILGRQPRRVGKMRHDAERRPAGAARDLRRSPHRRAKHRRGSG